MKEYDVKITETLEKTVTVQAENRDAAEEQVKTAYYNSEHILDAEQIEHQRQRPDDLADDGSLLPVAGFQQRNGIQNYADRFAVQIIYRYPEGVQ